MANETNRISGKMGSGNVSVSSRNSSISAVRASPGRANEQNLNPSMSRGGFVKTVGVAGAAMGIGAAGFAGAAKAQVPSPPRTITIYPKGQASGAGNDTDTIIAAIKAAADGDIILMKHTSEGGNVGTPWVLAKPREGYDFSLTAPKSTFKFNKDFSPAPYDRYVYDSYVCINVQKGVTFRGEVDAEGKPITRVTQYETAEAWAQIAEGLYSYTEPAVPDPACFVVSGVTSALKKPKFENLFFHYIPHVVITIAPFECSNCRFESSFEPIVAWIDDRFVFPQLSASRPNFDSMVQTIVKDCVVRDCGGFVFAIGSGMLIENNDFAKTPANTGSFTMIMAAASVDAFTWYAVSVAPGVVQTRYSKKNIIRYNKIDRYIPGKGGAGEEPVPFCYGISIWSVFDGICEDNEIYGNELSNLGGLGIEVGYAAEGSITRRNSCYNNTFNKVQCPLIIDGYDNGLGIVSMPSECVAMNNTIIDMVHAPASDYWGPYSPGAFLMLARNCRLVDNDYTRSGLLGWGKSPNQFGCIWAISSDSNTLKEYLFPAGTTICNQFLDDLGTNNQILGRNGQPIQCTSPSDIRPALEDMLAAIKERNRRRKEVLGNLRRK